MMSISVRIGGGVGGIIPVETKNYVFSEGTTLQELLEKLSRSFGQDIFHPTVLVTVNGGLAKEEDRVNCMLEEGDVVSVIRAIAGG